jgi:hypothetical protein
MADIDHCLIHEARRFVTGENVHYVKTWIFCYETSKPHSERRERYEKLLRDFVMTKRLNLVVRSQAAEARAHSKKICRLSDVFNALIDNAARQGHR